MTVALRESADLSELVARHGGRAPASLASRVIARLATPWEGDDGDDVLVPVLRAKGAAALSAGRAALLAAPDVAARLPADRTWVHTSPSDVVARLLRDADVAMAVDERALAHIDPRAEVAASAKIGAFSVVRAGAVIGDDATLGAHVVVHGGVIIGARVVIGDGAVVGAPGFGWSITPDGAARVPQLGGVRVEDDVEIGALSTIDAGTIGPTVIEQGAKLDAHVHVGHNARIGARSIVAAQSGFAGSSRVGRGVLVGGQVGVADHAEIGDGARLAARAGVIGDVPEGATYAGYPAVARALWLRAHAWLYRGRRA